MTHETGTLRTADGLDLFTRRWLPDMETRAAVALVHGVHEHSGRYAYVASALMRRGVAVHAVDLRGHGQSPGERGRVGSFDEYVLDVARLLEETFGAAGGTPVFLMGHSMGGLVAAATVVERGAEGLAGLVLSSAALRVPATTPAALRKLAPLVARVAPGLPVQRLDLSGLSRDPVVVRNYGEDPLTTTQAVRAHTANAILEAAERVRQRPEAFRLPLYLFHGTADRITDPAGTRWLAEHAPSDDVTLRLYDGLYHEALNEPERDEVIRDLADWLVDRAGAPAP